MKIELHMHTRYSHDSLLSFRALYLKLLLSGIDAVGITDHNSIQGALEFKRFCITRRKQIEVIIGEEIFTEDGEIIGLYLQKKIEPNQKAEATIKEILDQGGIVYIPHPYDIKRKKTVLSEHVISKCKEQIDCIEVHNGRNIEFTYSIEQQKISKKYALVPVVGSDAHTYIEVGRNYIISPIQDLSTPESFKEMLGDCRFVTEACLPIAHSLTKAVKLNYLIRQGRIDEIFRIITRTTKRDQY